MADAGGCKDADAGAAKNQVLNHDRHNVRGHGPSAGRKKRGIADAAQNQVFSFLGYILHKGMSFRYNAFFATMTLSAAAVCLIACHAGPANHFATFAERLMHEGKEVCVYASGPAQKVFEGRRIVALPFDADAPERDALAEQIAKSCACASAVLTDVGHAFDAQLHKALADRAPDVLRLVYYDNPEPCVPGGYSNVAADVMQVAHRVLFANAHLEKEPIYREQGPIALPAERRLGIGYYPVSQADDIARRRMEEQKALRAEWCAQHGIEDKGQKLLVYFGGNNEEYFAHALPTFLGALYHGVWHDDLSDFIFVVQQHPGAKKENRDRAQVEAWIDYWGEEPTTPRIILSETRTEDVLAIADGALYAQTSMGPLFALSGIPTVQVNRTPYADVLVRGKLCTAVQKSSDFLHAIKALKPEPLTEERRKSICASLGVRDDWWAVLQGALSVRSYSFLLQGCSSERVEALQEAHAFFGWNEHTTFEPLSGGLSPAQLYVFKQEGSAYVLRFLNSSHAQEVREKEISALTVGHRLGVAPQCLFSDAHAQLLVMPFIEGDVLHNPSDVQLIQMGNLLRTLHAYSGAYPTRMGFQERLKRHYTKGVESGVAFPSDFHRAVESILSKASKRPLVPTHGDLNPSNILAREDDLMIVDWACATMDDPLSDLSYFSALSALSPEQESCLLEAYLGRMPSEQDLAELREEKAKTHLLTATIWFRYSESLEERKQPRDVRVAALDKMLHAEDLVPAKEYIKSGIVVNFRTATAAEIKAYALSFYKAYLDYAGADYTQGN